MSTPSGQGPDDGHSSAPIAPIPQQSASARSNTASIMWAVAVIVVALVGGFLIYTAMTRDQGPGDAGRGSSQDGTRQEATAPDEATAGSDATGPVDDAAEATQSAGRDESASPTLTDEQQEFLLGLARRDADDPLAKGDVDAPVVIIEYADYRCPYCASWARDTQPALQDLIDDGTVRLEFRDRVLFGEESEATALAARAAGEQGLFWEFHEAVFAAAPASGHPDMPREKLLGFAEEIGVPDLAQFEADMDSPELRAAMEADQAEADSIGVRSTPTFLVNTVALVGARPEPAFRAAVAQELEKVQEGP